jgi:hypothetical protein
MVLQDLFDTLATGEFANLSLANSTTGSIKEEAYPKIVQAINRSLLELYKRFLLKEKKVYLVQQSGLYRYYLRTSYIGDSSATSTQAYLLGHPDELFQEDVIRILSITDSEGLTVAINPSHPGIEQTYFRTAQFDTLDLTTTKTNETFVISYQASYPKIKITETFDPDTLNLYYPPFIEDALCNHIASLLLKGKATKASEGEGYASNTFAAKYEMACLKLIELGLAEESYFKNDRFERNGFV